MATRSETKALMPARKSALRDPAGYPSLRDEIVGLLQSARQTASRTVNAIMTATYWDVGRRIVEAEQKGKRRADYGEQLIERLAKDLTVIFGRGFGMVNLTQMRRFYLLWPQQAILQTVSEESPSEIIQTPSAHSVDAPSLASMASRFPLPWSAYVRLLAVKNEHARAFYETEALRCGWSVRQLDRQIASQFYERTAMSKNKASMLKKGEIAQPGDTIDEMMGQKGYAAGFEGLIGYLKRVLPHSEVIQQSLRTEVCIYPEIALRELAANALIHQDFNVTGSGPMIEIFDDRIEFTNPGSLLPGKRVDRLIGATPESRNETLASAFRRYRICEERGTGFQKVVASIELFGLPPVVFTPLENAFKVTLYAPKKFADMSQSERIEACYQHAVLKFFANSVMTNTSVANRK